MFYKYPETVTLNKRPELLAVKEVIATEKLHGTNFRLYFPAGMASIAEVQYGGRNEEFGTDDGGKFYGGRPVRWFKERPELLQRLFELFRERAYGGVILYGEICGAGIQKGVRYAKEDAILFRAFDIRIGEAFVTYDLFVELCDAAGLPRVPEVWRGEPSLAAFDALLEKPSAEGLLGGVTDERNLMEGVVLRSNPLLRNLFGEWLIVKHKSEAFEEVTKRNIRADRPDMTPVESFARTFVVRGRVINALGRLRDAGTPLVDDMQDMPHLVRAMVDDLRNEAAEEWKALNDLGFDDRAIRSSVTRVLGSVYRSMLIESAVGTGR